MRYEMSPDGLRMTLILEPEKEETKMLCPKCGTELVNNGWHIWCHECGWEDFAEEE